MSSTKKYWPFAIVFIFIFLVTLTNPVFSQNNRVENFIKSGPADAETLTKAYLRPYPSGVGGSLNTAWFNSASTHKKFGIDVQIRASLAIVPSSDQNFNVEDLNLKKVHLVDGESSFSPTGAGIDTKGPRIEVQDQERTVSSFNLPQGSGYQVVPAPIMQASVGLIKNTDLTVRFIPKIKGEIVDFNMRGIGIKHSISQWLPGDKLLPFDISIFAGINHVDMAANFDMDPPQPDPATNYDNQKVFIDFNTFAAKLLVGKDLSFLSLYSALGYETSTMDLDVTGNYPIPVSGSGGTTVIETLTDPFSYSQKGSNKFSLTGGFTFQLSFVQFIGEFTLADYPSGNVGIGFSIR